MWKYNYTDELYHYGIPGMRWGVRRARNSSKGSLFRRNRRKIIVSDDHKEVATIRKKKLKEMSNHELKTVNKRMEMESKYRELSSKASIGKRVTQAVIGTGLTIVALETAANTYKRVGKAALSKIGKKVIK